MEVTFENAVVNTTSNIQWKNMKMPTYFSISDIKQHHYDTYVSESCDIKCQEINLLCACVLASWQCVKPYRYQLSPASWYSRSQFVVLSEAIW